MGIAQSLQQSVRPYHLFGLQVAPEQDIYLEGLPMRRGEQWVSRETLGRNHLPEITELHRRELLLPYRGPYGFNAFDYEHFTIDLLYECYCMTGMAWMKDELALLGEQLKGMLRPAKYYFSTPRHTRGEGWCMKGLALIHRATRNESLRQLAVERIPEVWNAKMQELVGVTPSNDAEGCLQDIHWSMGAFGYFPTYALGNLYAAQFFAAARRDLARHGADLDAQMTAADVRNLLEWMRTNVHRHGMRYDAGGLCRKATGADLSVEPFLDYVTAKYRPIYGL